MIRNFFSTPNVIGRLMLILLFVGGVVYAGAFSGFVVETEATSCCGGETNTCGVGTDALIFSSSEDCDEDVCNRCACRIAGCSDCKDIGCGSDKDGNSCSCGTSGGGGIGGNAADGCGVDCSSETDKDYLCNNDCSYI